MVGSCSDEGQTTKYLGESEKLEHTFAEGPKQRWDGKIFGQIVAHIAPIVIAKGFKIILQIDVCRRSSFNQTEVVILT